jgi:hypothetical protein
MHAQIREALITLLLKWGGRSEAHVREEAAFTVDQFLKQYPLRLATEDRLDDELLVEQWAGSALQGAVTHHGIEGLTRGAEVAIFDLAYSMLAEARKRRAR